ncbi:MAG: DUF6399 domain-containing protein [Cyanobacteria bacterium J06623_5]
MPSNIRERRQEIADCIQTRSTQTLSAIASATGISRSSVHRHRQAIARSDQYPESSFWESAAGHQWLTRLVFGVVYHFGIKQGLGAESLSSFLQSLHVDTHVGVSASSLRQLKARAREVILEYERAQAEQCQPSAAGGICVGADETFFDLPILVLMELASGFIFVETEAENRTYDTWMAQVQQWWSKGAWQCQYLVSDGAKALVKLAVSGLGCVNVPDVFHSLRALGRPIGRALGQQFAVVKQQQRQCQKQLNQAREADTIAVLESQLAHHTAAQQQLCNDEKTYLSALQQVSQTLHPFTLDSQSWQCQADLLTHLAAPLQDLWNLAPTYGAQKAHKAIDTFEAQLNDVAQGIDAWQQWVCLALDKQTQDPRLQDWVKTILLPWVYWSKQADKTRKPHLKQTYQQAASDAFDKLFEHPLTLQLDEHTQIYWRAWAHDWCDKYQRTSSAVEGRNGYLAQRHQARRGFSQQSLKVLTILHNFDLKRADGTTAAQRLFGQPFPDPFEWMLERVGDLPMPRRSTKAQSA